MKYTTEHEARTAARKLRLLDKRQREIVRAGRWWRIIRRRRGRTSGRIAPAI